MAEITVEQQAFVAMLKGLAQIANGSVPAEEASAFALAAIKEMETIKRQGEPLHGIETSEMPMTPHEAAARLNGNEYGKEGSRELWAEMKAAGLVAVFGASDDLMEFRGAIDEEIGAYDGGTAYLTPVGLVENNCENDDCPHYERLTATAATIDAKFDEGGFSWVYGTTIPHDTFVINEDGEPYCQGIVFALADVPDPSAEAAARACYDVTNAAFGPALYQGWTPLPWEELQEKERELHRNYARAARAA